VTTIDPLEARLEHLFAVDMPAAVVDRTEARMKAASVSRRRPARRMAPMLRRSLVLAVAATLILAAASVGVLTLYERVAHIAWAGDRLAWERSVELDLTVETDAGTMTLARGYADSNRVVLAFGVSDADVVRGRDLRDAQGRTYVPAGGWGYSEVSGEEVMLESWLAPEPLPPGALDLTLTPHEAQAAWSLTFTLSVEAGVTLEPRQVIRDEGVSIELERFTVSPTAVIAEVQLSGLDVEKSWVAIGRVTHDGVGSIADDGMNSIEDADDPMHQTIIVSRGSDDPHGEWTLRIDEVVGFDANGDQIRIAGPWEFSVTLP